MKAAACSWRTITGLILVECLSAIMAPAAFSPAPPKAASTPTLSNALTIASYTRIGRALPGPRGISRRLGQPPLADWGREYRSLGKIQLQIVGCTTYADAVAAEFEFAARKRRGLVYFPKVEVNRGQLCRERSKRVSACSPLSPRHYGSLPAPPWRRAFRRPAATSAAARTARWPN